VEENVCPYVRAHMSKNQQVPCGMKSDLRVEVCKIFPY